MTVPCPAQIKVGWTDYSIKGVKFDDPETWGQTDTEKLEIRVDFSRRDVVHTVVHEMLHAIAHVWELPRDRDENELWVSGLASGLLAVWRDNPDLIQFIDQSVRK